MYGYIKLRRKLVFECIRTRVLEPFRKIQIPLLLQEITRISETSNLIKFVN